MSRRNSTWHATGRSLRRRLSTRAGARCGTVLLRWLVGSCRTSVTGWEEHVETAHRQGKTLLFALWHNRLLVPVWRFRGRGIHVLVTRNADGDVLTRILERLGWVVVRGSAERSATRRTKGGARALAAMARAGREGHDLAFTPDGPRGPIYSIAPGLLTLARLARCDVVPVGIECVRYWRLSSWDRFRIPKPFSRSAAVFGTPITLSDEDERAHAQVVEGMLAATRDAADRVGIEDPFADAGPVRVGALKT